MKNKDIKYLGVPNVCFSLTEKNDKREDEFKTQRIERGFDDSETWSLRDTIANFIIPRLERYQEIAKDFLARDEDLISDIDLFLESMRLVAEDKTWDKNDLDKINKGMSKFQNIFLSLWW